MLRTSLATLLVLGSFLPVRSAAEPIMVKYSEGVARGFPVLRSLAGEKLAQGELLQIPRAYDVLESRLTFRFNDGSLYDERVVFSQRRVFTLLSYRLPSFPEAVEASIDRATGEYHVVYRGDDEDSPEETLTGRVDLPPDVYNGLLTMLMKNLPEGDARVVQIVTFTPKPRFVKMLLTPAAEDPVEGERRCGDRHPLPDPAPARPVRLAPGDRHPRRQVLDPRR